MTDFSSLARARRSHRAFTPEKVSPQERDLLLEAAILSPTSKNRRDWEFVAVEDTDTIAQLAQCKPSGSAFLEGAPLAIAVLGNSTENSCWIEDGSVAAASIMYQAEDLGLGSCWIQVRGREHSPGKSASDYVREVLGIPQGREVLCLLAIGHKAQERPAKEAQSQEKAKIHIGHYCI